MKAEIREQITQKLDELEAGINTLRKLLIEKDLQQLAEAERTDVKIAALVAIVEKQMASGTTHVTPIGANIFDDLGFPADEARRLQAQLRKIIAKKRAAKQKRKTKNK